MQYLDVGEIARPESHWYDANGDAVEPSAITLVVTDPAGTDTTTTKAGLTQGATTADWYLDVVANAAGLWRYTFTGTVDGGTVVESGMFLVGADVRTGPCEPWVTWEEITACTSVDLSSLSSAQRESAIDQASEILWNLSGRVYSGICETTRSICFGCVSCFPRVCACEPVNGVDLGIRAPVWAVWAVTVDGDVLDPSAYTLIDRRWLALTDGTSFPSGWNLLDPARFRATWAYGRPVPEGGRAAAAAFAVEIAKKCAGQQCQFLPQTITNVSREGTSYAMVDPSTIADGKTGITLVDLWLTADRKGRRRGPRVFSPGAASQRFVR